MGPVPRRISIPRPHKAFGLCALGFTQFKADGLVQTYGLPTSNHSYDLATLTHTPLTTQPATTPTTSQPATTPTTSQPATLAHTPFHSFSEKNKFHPIALLA